MSVVMNAGDRNPFFLEAGAWFTASGACEVLVDRGPTKIRQKIGATEQQVGPFLSDAQILIIATAETTYLVHPAEAWVPASLVPGQIGDLSGITVADYTEFRASTSTAKQIEVTGYLGSAVPSGIAGVFVKDMSGSGADNGGTIIVRSDGARYRRVGATEIQPDMFDGADDDARVTSALDVVCATGGTLQFLPGVTYTLTEAISKTIADGIVVKLIGHGAIIDGTAVTGSGTPGDTTLITLKGSRLGSSLLSASPSKGAFSITTSSSISAVAGESLLITSTDLFNPTRPTYFSGEMVTVVSAASAPTYTLNAPLFGGYTAANTTVHRLAMPTVEAEGLDIRMNANQMGIALQYCKNPKVRSCKVKGARYTGIQFYYCMGGDAIGNFVSDAWYAGTGVSYGIMCATSQGLTIAYNMLSEARHCIASGGQEPCRNLAYVGNVCTMHPSQNDVLAIDMHGNTELSEVVGNFAEGLSLSGINLKVIGNTLTGNIASKILLNIYQEISSDYYEIIGNSISSEASGMLGIWISPVEANLSIDRLTISGNTVNTPGSGIRVAPRTSSETGCSIRDLKINGNSVKTASEPSLNVASNGAATYAITSLNSNGNTLYSSASKAAVTTTAIVRTTSVGDRFLTGEAANYICSFGGGDVKIIAPHFEGNVTSGGASRSVYYGNTGKTKCVDPTFVSLTYKAEIPAGGTTEYMENGWTETTPTILNTGGARLVNFYGGTGRTLAYGTATPTVGVFILGDRVQNQAGVVGQAKAWTCTTAGGAASTTRADTTAYAAGVWAVWTTGTTVWKCTTAGTSDGSAPSIVGLVVGDTVAEGGGSTVVWTMMSLTTAAFTSEGNL